MFGYDPSSEDGLPEAPIPSPLAKWGKGGYIKSKETYKFELYEYYPQDLATGASYRRDQLEAYLAMPHLSPNCVKMRAISDNFLVPCTECGTSTPALHVNAALNHSVSSSLGLGKLLRPDGSGCLRKLIVESVMGVGEVLLDMVVNDGCGRGAVGYGGQRWVWERCCWIWWSTMGVGEVLLDMVVNDGCGRGAVGYGGQRCGE